MSICVQNHWGYFERPDISTLESDMKSVFLEISKDQLEVN